MLLGLPYFVMELAGALMDLRQLRAKTMPGPLAYFRGLNLLLNEQQDQAIDAFIEAVQNDPPTRSSTSPWATCFAGAASTKRAVRMHEHLLSRTDLAVPTATVPACPGAGLPQAPACSTAEERCASSGHVAFEGRGAPCSLLAIYERSVTGPRPPIARPSTPARGQLAGRMAHYLCEQGAGRAAQGRAVRGPGARTRPSTAPDSPGPGSNWPALQSRRVRRSRIIYL